MTAAGSEAAGDRAGQLERLARLIPGIGIYQDREGLRETDKRVRTYLADLLTGVARDLEPVQRALGEGDRLDRLPALERVGRQLATLADRIRFASYGFAGVFALQKIREAELRALHDFDLQLLQGIPRLRSRVQALGQAARGEEFPGLVQAMEESLRGLEGLLDERDRLARGL